jgi:hypothetical protein
LVSQHPVNTNFFARLIVIGHLFVLIVVIIFVDFIVLKHANNGFVIAFAAELEERARLAVFGVCFEVALFVEKWEDIKVFLQSTFVVQIAEDLLCAGGGCGCDVFAAIGAFAGFVGF